MKHSDGEDLEAGRTSAKTRGRVSTPSFTAHGLWQVGTPVAGGAMCLEGLLQSK